MADNYSILGINYITIKIDMVSNKGYLQNILLLKLLI